MIKYICPACGTLQEIKDIINRGHLIDKKVGYLLKEQCSKCLDTIKIQYGASDCIISEISGLEIHYFVFKDIFQAQLEKNQRIIQTHPIKMFKSSKDYLRLKLYLYFKINHNKDLDTMIISEDYTTRLLKGGK